MNWTDTHCHIHETGYSDPEGAHQRAVEAGVTRLICVGTDEQSSREAVEFARTHENVWASVGLHPHDATSGAEAIATLEDLIITDRNKKIVAVGECGLDYFYDNSPREEQIEMLEAQLQLAKKYDLPIIFHVREAFADFWPLFDHFQGLRGVLHSFTDNMSNLEQGLSRGLLVGVNGISTFTKDANQQAMFAAIPLDRVVFETDSPFLTPVPYRGQTNEPRHILSIAEHFAREHQIELSELSAASENNVQRLFFQA